MAIQTQLVLSVWSCRYSIMRSSIHVYYASVYIAISKATWNNYKIITTAAMSHFSIFPRS